MVLGAVNLGNVMVSASQNGADLWAIDTTAELDPTLNVKAFAEEGLGEGFSTVKQTLKDMESGVILSLLGGTIIDKLGGRNSAPGQVFEQRWKAEFPQLQKAFMLYLSNALLDIHDLATSKAGKAKMKGLTQEYQGGAGAGMLSYPLLKSTAMYLGGRGMGMDHAEAMDGPLAKYAAATLERVGPATFPLPLNPFRPEDSRAAAFECDIGIGRGRTGGQRRC